MSDDDRLIYETEPAPSAVCLTVTPATLRRAEALGWTPGDGDVLTWALGLLESDDPEGVARRSDLMDAGHSNHCAARTVGGDGACTCGRDAGRSELRGKEYWITLHSRTLRHRICGHVVRSTVRQKSGVNETSMWLCVLPEGHGGDHAETLAGDDTDTDRSMS